jgi:putative GTP pyrophosphokinase
LTAHDRRLTLGARSGDCLALGGLSQWLESGSVEAAIEAMAKKIELPHWVSKGAINRAGEAIRNQTLTLDQTVILESWRIAHRTVIHTFEALLRARAKKNQDVKIAQRLKRRTTIVDKLSRLPKMELARMDDVAGCRLIFPSLEALREFRGKVHQAKFRHILKNEKEKYDYIKTPTNRGYRGIHDVYEFRSKREGKSKKCDGLLIELQYRTNVHHAWATAVEVVTQMTENEPKFNRGDPRHIRFFCLASEILARAHEGLESCALSMGNKELYEEFDDLDHEINVMNMLARLAVNEWIGKVMEGASHIILQITKAGKLQLHQFDLELEASTRLLELEREFPKDDIVLVGAETIEEITSAFRNYFHDVREFLDLMIKARARLAPNTVTARVI